VGVEDDGGVNSEFGGGQDYVTINAGPGDGKTLSENDLALLNYQSASDASLILDGMNYVQNKIGQFLGAATGFPELSGDIGMIAMAAIPGAAEEEIWKAPEAAFIEESTGRYTINIQVAEHLSEPRTLDFYDPAVKTSRGIFNPIEAPARLPDRISLYYGKGNFNRVYTLNGEPLYSFYWNEPGGIMVRQANHYGAMNLSNWSLLGPDGWVAPPDGFKMFYGNMPASSIPLQNLFPNYR